MLVHAQLLALCQNHHICMFYQFMVSAASALGEQISAVTLDSLSRFQGSDLCDLSSLTGLRRVINFQFAQPFLFVGVGVKASGLFT